MEQQLEGLCQQLGMSSDEARRRAQAGRERALKLLRGIMRRMTGGAMRVLLGDMRKRWQGERERQRLEERQARERASS